MSNLILNPGAEDGLDYWDEVLVDDPVVAPQSQASCLLRGAKGFKLRSEWAGGMAGGIEQQFDTIPGTTYEITFWVNNNNAEAPAPFNTNNLRLMIDINGDAFSTPQQHSYLHAPATGWTKQTQTFVANTVRCGVQFRPIPTSVGLPVATAHWCLDLITLPGVTAPTLPEGPEVTIGDILDNVQFDACDFTGDYRKAARRWLNAVRSKVAESGFWKQAMTADGLIVVSGTDTTGIYPLRNADSPTPQVWAFVAGDRLRDETNNRLIWYRDVREIQGMDPNDSRDGNAYYFYDAGYNSSGEPLIGFWPKYDVAATITGPLYKQFSDLTETDDGLAVDPYFGKVSDWSAVFIEGLRYFGEQNENEQGTDSQWTRLELAIRTKKAKQGITVTGSTRLRNLSPTFGFRRALALFDPAHYDNPEI